MGNQFKVGCSYFDSDKRFDPITITKRTEKTIWVTNGQSSWMMRIWGGGTHEEYAIDSKLPRKYRFICSYKASNKI